jgi:lipid A 3-O-deacylase PagL
MMNLFANRFWNLSPFLLLATTWLPAQTQHAEEPNRDWDLGIWAAGATGEENTNSFAETQILSSGIYVGRVLTGEIGAGWRRGHFEYGFDVAPIFAQFTPQHFHGVAFDPVIIRWHSGLRLGRTAPFLELGGGAVHTTQNFPAGDTATFNFIARGGGIRIANTQSQAFEISCRWWHISNANLGRRNPEFNGIQVGVGYHWLK